MCIHRSALRERRYACGLFVVTFTFDMIYAVHKHEDTDWSLRANFISRLMIGFDVNT